MTHERVDQAGAGREGRLRLRPAFVLPLLLFAAVAAAFFYGLGRRPDILPSALIGKPVPEFSLPPVPGRELGLSNEDLKGEVSLVNVFASWCVECRVEHPVFMELSRRGIVPVHGLNYKDRPEDARRWLDRLGDPYVRTGADVSGRVGIEWGVYGVPETFVVTADGRIAYRHVGAVTPEVLRETLLPLVKKLQREARGAID